MENYRKSHHEIIRGLFIGNSKSANEYIENCTLFINCDLATPDNSARCISPEMTEIEKIHIKIYDSPEHNDLLYSILSKNDICEKIHERINRGENVLVYCLMGMQRSCAVVACYLIKYYHYTPEYAISFIQSKRKVAFYGTRNTSCQFRQTLDKWYIKNNNSNTLGTISE